MDRDGTTDLVVTDGSAKHLLASGQIEVLANLAAVNAPYDGRSRNQRILDALDAAIEGRASKEQLSYTIGNRQLTYISIKEKMELREKYAVLVANEKLRARIADGGDFFTSVKAKFTR